MSLAMQNMVTMCFDDINKKNLIEKLNQMLNNQNLKAHAKEIASLLHHNSVKFSNEFKKNDKIDSNQISSNHFQLDGLGALFFVIFLIVKVSLQFCRFYNSWINTTTGKTK